MAHDFSKSIYDCPACQRLGQIKHDFSKPPSECPGCREKAAIGSGYAAHATSSATGGRAHQVAIGVSVSRTPAHYLADLERRAKDAALIAAASTERLNARLAKAKIAASSATPRSGSVNAAEIY